MSSLKCSCIDCDNIATHTWSGHPTCDSCGSPSRINESSKPFDITKHEVANHITVLEKGNIGVFDCGWIIDKDRAIAIAKALGVTGEDLK